MSCTTDGEFWEFYADRLEPSRRYVLSLDVSSRALCEPWDLSTFPDPNARPEQFRVLFFTCAGGHDAFGFVPTAARNRVLRRALSFHPQAAVANGDHIYWGLLAPRGSAWLGATAAAERLAGTFTRSAVASLILAVSNSL